MGRASGQTSDISLSRGAESDSAGPYVVLSYQEALDAGAIDADPWGDNYGSYLVCQTNGELLMSDGWYHESPEDITLTRALSFLAPLLNSLSDMRSFKVIDSAEAHAGGIEDVDLNEPGNYLVEVMPDGGLDYLWSDAGAYQWREDLTLGRQFSFIAPLLNRLVA